MKKDIVYSLLLHILIAILAIWIVRSKNIVEQKPFVATIVTPEELQEQKQPEVRQQQRGKDISRMPRLPKDLPAPDKLSALPSSPSAKKSSSRQSGEKPAISRNSTPQAGKPEPAPPANTRGPAEEMQAPGGRNEFAYSPRPSAKPYSGMATRQKIFDPDVIAKAVTNDKEKSGKDAGITFDTTEYKYYGYMQRLREKIEGIWKYPAEAQDRKLNGDLYIRFTIRKDGTLAQVELLHTSGYKILDDAAIKALREANPYWPLPDSWKQDSLTITGKFVYYFSSTFIR